MDYFYIIVVVVAVVILILCLVAVGLSLQTKNTADPFPKLQAPCPDGWAVSDSGVCTMGSVNKGSPVARTGTTLSGTIETNVWSSLTSNAFTPNTTATICNKRAWAIDKGITWDGVSNYNQCA